MGVLDKIAGSKLTVEPNLPVEGVSPTDSPVVPSIFQKIAGSQIPTGKADITSTVDENAGKHNIDVSKYKDYIPEGVFDNEALDETRAQRQGFLEKAGGDVIKMTGLAGSVYATTLASLPYGIISSMFSGRGADVFDNPISQGLDGINKTMEEVFPNYYTKKEQDAALYSPNYWFTTNFLFDKVLKNAGFTIGAVAAGSDIAKALSGFGKMAMGERYAAELKKVVDLTNKGKTWREALKEVGDGIRLSNGIQKLGAATIAAGGEASFEALDGKQTVKQDLVQQYKDTHGGMLPDEAAMLKIEELSDASANVRYGLNIPLLAIGDYLQFGRMFSGFSNEKEALKGIYKNAQGLFEADSPKFINRVASAGRGLITEANEEGTQYAIQRGTQDYYERKYDGRAKGTLDNILSSTIEGLKVEFGSKEGWENILLGGITGLGFGFATGENQRAFRKNSAEVEHAVGELNKYTTSGIFKQRYDGAIRDQSIQAEMNDALKKGDIFQYKNLEFDKFKNLVDVRTRTGQFDSLVNELQDLKHLPKEEFERTFGVGYDGKNRVPAQYVDGIIKEAKELSDLRKDIDNRFGAYDEATRTRMFDAASNGYNTDKREQELSSQLAQLTKGYITKDNVIPTAINYDKLKGLGDDAFKEQVQKNTDLWLSTNPDPLTKVKVFETIRDLNQLRIRRHNFGVLYHRLVDPRYNEEINASAKAKEDAIKEEQFQKYKDEVDARVKSATNREGLLNDLKEESNKQSDERYRKHVDSHVNSIENEIKLTNNKTAVNEAKVESTKPVINDNPPPPRTDGTQINSVDQFKAGALYAQVQRKLSSNTKEDVLDAIDDLQQVVDKNPNQDIKAFAQSEIDRLKAKLEPETSDHPETSFAQIVNTNESTLLENVTSTVEPTQPKEVIKPVVKNTSMPLSANIYLMDAEEGIKNNQITKNEKGIKSLLSPSLNIGSKVVLVPNDTITYGQNEKGEHTIDSLPIEIRDEKGNRLGFLNTLTSIKEQLELAKKVNKMRITQLLKLSTDPNTDKKTRDLVNLKIGETSFGTGEVNRTLNDLIVGWQDNYTATHSLRAKIWDQRNASGENTYTTYITKKTSGTITKSSKLRDVTEIFGMDVQLFAPVPDASGITPSTRLVSLDDKEELFVRNPVTTDFTNHDMQYTQGLVYVLIDGANVDKSDINTKLPSPLITRSMEVFNSNLIIPKIGILLEQLKQGKSLASQDVNNLKDQIGLYIHVNNLDDTNNNFKVHADKIEIADGERTVFLYTKGYNAETKESYPLDGFNLTVVDNKTQETINRINSKANPQEFNKELLRVISQKSRQIDYNKLKSTDRFTDPFLNVEYNNYREWIFRTEGLSTDVSILRDKNGDFVSHVTPIGKANLVLSIDANPIPQSKTATEKKADETKKEEKETPPNSEDDLTNVFYAYYNPNIPSFVKSVINVDDYGFQNGKTRASLALEGVLKNTTRQDHKEVAEFLQEHIRKNNINIEFVNEVGLPNYSTGTNTITIPKQVRTLNGQVEIWFPTTSDFNRLILHEIKHALTVYPFVAKEGTLTEEEEEYKKNITDLFNEAKKYLEATNPTTNRAAKYGFTKVEEFIAELDVNSQFQELLNSIKIEKAPQGIWEKIKYWFNKLLGRITYRTLSNEARTITHNFISETFSDLQRQRTNPRANRSFNSAPIIAREADAHYVNIMAGLVFEKIKKNPDLKLSEVIANPDLSIKKAVYTTMKAAAEKGMLKDEFQKDVFLRIADSIDDNVNGVWTPISRKDDLGFWRKTLDYVDRRLGFSIEDEDIDLQEIKENRRDWDDTNIARVSTKNGVSNQIKVMIMTSPKLASIDYTITDKGIRYNADKDTISGLADFLDYDTIYPYILKSMIGVYNAQDVFDRLDIMATHDPSFIRIKHLLEADSILLSDWIKQFTLQNPFRDYVKIETVKGDVKIEVDQSNKETDPVYVISNKWINKIKTYIDNNYFTPKIQNEFNGIYKDLEVALYHNEIEKAAELLHQAFSKIGIDLPSNVFEKEVLNPVNVKKFEKPSITLNKLFVDRLNHLRGAVFTGKFNNYGDVNYLASIASLYTYDIAEGSYLSVEGKVIYSAMLPNFLSRIYNLFTSTNTNARKELETLIRNYAKENAMAYSNWMWDMKGFRRGFLKAEVEGDKFAKNVNTAAINEDFIKNFKYSYLDGSKRIDTKDSKVYSNYSDRDWRLMQTSLYLDKRNPTDWIKVPILVPSDSGNIYFLQVPKVKLLTGEYVGRLSRNSNIWKSVYRTVLQEIERMKAARQLMFTVASNGDLLERDITNLKLQRYYHYQNVDENGKPIILKNGVPTGNVFKFWNIPSLNKLDLRINGVLYENLTGDHIGYIKQAVDSFISEEVAKGLTEYKGVENTVAGQHDGIGDGTFENFVAEYVMNHYLANVEQANFFYGSVAEYKSAIDTNKRAKEVSTVKSILSGLHTGDTYKGVTLRDVKLKAQFYNEITEAVKNLVRLERGYSANTEYEGEFKKDVEEIIKPYAKINTADAQGYITLERYRNVLKDLGKWNLKLDALYDRVKAGKQLNTDEITVFMQPLKPFYYGRDYDFDLNRFVSNQVKFALVPLLPQLTIGTQLDTIRKYAEVNNIDEIYFESSEKVGSFDITDITDGKGNLVKEKLNNLEPREYYNRNWGHQLDVPDHITDEVNLLGTQIMKLIIANIDGSTNYAHGNFSLTGEKLIDHYQDVLGVNIKESAAQLLKRFGAEIKGNDVIIPNIKELREVLLSELEKRGLSDNYKSAIDLLALDNGDVTFKLPLFVNNMTNKFESVLTSLFTNNVTNQKFPGLHAVLLSNVFLIGDAKTLGDLTETKVGKTTGIEYTKEFKDDVLIGKRTTKLQSKIIDGHIVHEVLVGAWSKKFFKDGKRISVDDIPADLRNMIAYRIPTQAKHSMAYIEVVGFLPSVSGSTMVFPDDIVTQMNGDFDLDTIYVMTQNFVDHGGDLKVYQGTKGDIDDREFNYFTTNEEEAKDYGKVRKIYLNPKNIFERRGKDEQEYLKIQQEMQKDIPEKDRVAIYTDILDNTKEGLEKLNKFFSILKSKGYDAYSEIHQNGKVREGEDNMYIVSLDNKIISNKGGLTKIEYTEGNTEADIDARYNAMYGRADKLRNYLDTIIAGEYSKMLDIKDDAIDNLFDVIFKEVPLLFSDEEVDEILKEGGYSIDVYNKIVDRIKNYPSRADFAKLPVEEQNSRKARENRIFDIYASILTNPAHIKEVITPAEFRDLTRIKDEINNAYHQDESNINPMTHSGQNVFRSKAIQGRALKGMAANANAFTAVAQVARIKLADKLGFIVKYNDRLEQRRKLYKDSIIEDKGSYIIVKHTKIGFDDAGTYLNADSYLITEKASQSIGNAVDIVKEGFVPYINTYTFDSWQTMQMTGISADVASYFYNQPIIRNLNDLYFDNLSLLETKTSTEIEDVKRGYQTALFKLLNADPEYKRKQKGDKTYKRAEWAITVKPGKTARPVYVTREETKALLGYDPDEVLPMYLPELKEQIEKYNKYNRGLLRPDKIKFLRYQLQVLEMFRLYKESGEGMADGIKVFNTNRLGAGPSMNVTRVLDKNIDYFTNYGAEGEPRLVVGDKPATLAIYPDSKDKKSVYPMLKSYYDHSNKLSVSTLSPLFLHQSDAFQRWLTSSFRYLKRGFNEELAGDLTSFANSYIMREHPLIRDINVERILGVDHKIEYNAKVTGEEWKNLSTANKVLLAQDILQDYLKEHPNHILNYLTSQVTASDIERNKFQYIKFLNTANDPIIDDYLVDSFTDMWKSSDVRISDLARDLFRYSYITSGFTFGKDSFAKIISSDILADDIGLGNLLRAKQKEAEEAKIGDSLFVGGDHDVIEKYLQNNWYSKSVVPIVKTDYEWENGRIKEEYIDENSEETRKVTKNNTPIWEANSNGIIVVDKSRLKRTPKETRNASVIRVLEYQKPDVLYKKFDPIDLDIYPNLTKEQLKDLDSKVYYHPINKLGNALTLEMSDNSVIAENNTPKDRSFYLSVIKGSIEGLVNYTPIMDTPKEVKGESSNQLSLDFDTPKKDIEDKRKECE